MIKKLLAMIKQVRIHGFITIDNEPAAGVKVYLFQNDIIVGEWLSDASGGYSITVPRGSSGKVATRLSAFDFEPAWYYFTKIKKSVRQDFDGHISQNPG